MVFMSKKAQKDARKRRALKKRKMEAEGTINNGSGIEKEKKKEEEEEEVTTGDGGDGKTIMIRIPSGLSGKEIRKFRKVERRKARASGKELDIIFVNADGTPSNDNNNNGEGTTTKESATESGQDQEGADVAPPKKKKRTFPRINELIQAEKMKLQLDKENAKREKELNSIPVDIKSQYVALDCEMVGIGVGGKHSALARVSIVDFDGNVVLDSFVKVPGRVTDFRTHVSGVRAKDIKTTAGAMDAKEIRTVVSKILKDKILVGHALRNDFQALMMDHPKEMVRDTARYTPLMRATGKHGGKLKSRKLRDLVKENLNMDIQVEGEAHDSTDDARAAMELYKHFRTSWEKEIEKKSSSNNKKK